MSALARALLADLGPDDLRELAAALAPYLPAPHPRVDGGWIDSRRAAEHLGVSRDALKRLTAARAIPFQQERPGARCWFRRTDLDAWRMGRLT